ncbi:MAG: hypothetical protein NXH78_01250 [Hyphomonadaceae bacterium]|nr:hypothetical protein [Hyphomonadaceae bacterium]
MQRDELEQGATAKGVAASSLRRCSGCAAVTPKIAPSNTRVNVHG